MTNNHQYFANACQRRRLTHSVCSCYTLIKSLTLGLFVSLGIVNPSFSSDFYTLQQWITPFTLKADKRSINYTWEQTSSSSKSICAIIPPSSTSYWFAVNYGLVKKARQLDVDLKVFHVLDRFNFNEHDKLIERCLAYKPRSLIISAALGTQVSQNLQSVKNKPTVLLVGKNIATNGIIASSATAYHDIGSQLAKYMNKNHAIDNIKQTVMFPGDQSEQFVNSFVTGFKSIINPNKYQLENIIYTSNSYVQIKAKLTEYLNNHLNTTVIVGSALVSQAAVEVLEEMSLSDEVQIISYELSAQVYRDIKRGNVVASISNLAVIQGLLAIDLAIKLESNPSATHISPLATIVDGDNVQKFDISYAFAPYGYRETLEVNR